MLNEQSNLTCQTLETQVYYEHIQEQGRKKFTEL